MIGPKTVQVKEIQKMKAESVANQIYIIEIEIENRGVPYAESFTVFTHICLAKVNEASSRMIVKTDMVFKNEVWGFIKEKIRLILENRQHTEILKNEEEILKSLKEYNSVTGVMII